MSDSRASSLDEADRYLEAAWQRALASADRVRAARLAEQKRLGDEAAAQKARTDAEMSALILEAARGSRITCATESECRKAFQLAQIYVSTKSDMKIQLATDTIVETYNPTESYRLGANVIKTPGAGQSAEIVLTVTCKECGEPMRKLQLMLMREFRQFVEARLRQ